DRRIPDQSSQEVRRGGGWARRDERATGSHGGRMGPIVVVVIALIVLVLAIGWLVGLSLRGERRTTTFEQTRAGQRVEVVVPNGAVSFVASAGPVRVERR